MDLIDSLLGITHPVLLVIAFIFAVCAIGILVYFLIFLKMAISKDDLGKCNKSLKITNILDEMRFRFGL